MVSFKITLCLFYVKISFTSNAQNQLKALAAVLHKLRNTIVYLYQLTENCYLPFCFFIIKFLQ